jgi:hypothetical protein
MPLLPIPPLKRSAADLQGQSAPSEIEQLQRAVPTQSLSDDRGAAGHSDCSAHRLDASSHTSLQRISSSSVQQLVHERSLFAYRYDDALHPGVALPLPTEDLRSILLSDLARSSHTPELVSRAHSGAPADPSPMHSSISTSTPPAEHLRTPLRDRSTPRSPTTPPHLHTHDDDDAHDGDEDARR